MGNCQAVDASALEIQLPDGKTERLYSQVTVSEVMGINPGHYVALIMPLSLSLPVPRGHNQEQVLKLLRPDETLTLGHTYRLITTQGGCLLAVICKVLTCCCGRARITRINAATIAVATLLQDSETLYNVTAIAVANCNLKPWCL